MVLTFSWLKVLLTFFSHLNDRLENERGARQKRFENRSLSHMTNLKTQNFAACRHV